MEKQFRRSHSDDERKKKTKKKTKKKEKKGEAKRRRSTFEDDDEDAMIGESEESSSSVLWSLLVNNNDDICFTHVLPRLSATDIKFLYGVNKETRALVKRSTRAGDLKERFKVREMSSISTLEVARENKSSWTNYWTDEEKSFCWRVAETNKLELLKWA